MSGRLPLAGIERAISEGERPLHQRDGAGGLDLDIRTTVVAVLTAERGD